MQEKGKEFFAWLCRERVFDWVLDVCFAGNSSRATARRAAALLSGAQNVLRVAPRFQKKLQRKLNHAADSDVIACLTSLVVV